MNHKQIITRWRDQQKPRGTGFNVYYEGKTIYSYGSHFPMAYITDITSGAILFTPIILINADSYSVSTSKHQGMVNAVCYRDVVIRVKTGTLKQMIYELEERGGISQKTFDNARAEIEKRIAYAGLKEKRSRTNMFYWHNQQQTERQHLSTLAWLPIKEHVTSEFEKLNIPF